VVLDPRACYRALQTRDERFDGRLFVGVTSTGIYCRPVCPARPPKPEHCRYFPSAAAAAQAGFRPCLRCRPETAPEMGSWRGTSNTVTRGLALIAEGALDDDGASVETLAERLGVGARQLRRLFDQHLGASPVAVAQTRRVLFAKQLIQETRLPMGEVALAAGFGSIRRFNETFRDLFQRPPSALRRKTTGAKEVSFEGRGVTVRLRYRPPYDWAAMMSYLRARAVDGVEHVDGSVYTRTLLQDGQPTTVEVSTLPDARSLAVTVRGRHVGVLPGVVARVRRAFDLGADVAVIGAHLACDPWLAPLVEQRPGLRSPGGWDGFELAARAVLGQNVSVEAGRRLLGRLVELCGAPLPAPPGGSLHRLFPTPARVAAADLSGLGVPGARREALLTVARAALADGSLFDPCGTVDGTVARLRALRGVGDWTAQYIALRAAREPDAFPASDAVLLRSVPSPRGKKPTPHELRERAERWRPWRAYAAQHIWTAAGAPGAARKDEVRHA
jgi:AraC family transcriptional regulator of adaptative response / DNA-3-methyladenine glycosylase II